MTKAELITLELLNNHQPRQPLLVKSLDDHTLMNKEGRFTPDKTVAKDSLGLILEFNRSNGSQPSYSAHVRWTNNQEGWYFARTDEALLYLERHKLDVQKVDMEQKIWLAKLGGQLKDYAAQKHKSTGI